MRTAIFTEGGKETGFGHITRCIALYQALLERNINPVFIVNNDEIVRWFLNRAGTNFLTYEPGNLIEHIGMFDAAIIDSYKLPQEIYIEISEKIGRLLYVDDFNRFEYPKGIVLNGSINAESIRYHKRDDLKYLLGTRYIPLRQEFRNLKKKKIRNEIENILITFGGGNDMGMNLYILEVIGHLFSDTNIFVSVGLDMQNIESTQNIAKNKNKVTLIYRAETLKEFMLNADLCISAGGQTTYELASTGTPTIGICFAENQRLNLQGWQEVGFIEFAGWYNESNISEKIEGSIKKLLDRNERLEKSDIGRTFVDGRGSQRVIEEFI